MKKAAEMLIEGIWSKIDLNLTYRTPSGSREFLVLDKTDSLLKVLAGGTEVRVARESFVDAVQYLLRHGHVEDNRCEIRSANADSDSGPLCLAAKRANSGVRCITYILPVLAGAGVVEIDATRPSSTWVL